MTEICIGKALYERFKTLNEFSGINYINENNIAYPNVSFEPPQNKRWFELSFLADKPTPASIGEEAQNRWNGIFQIDICTPLAKGVDEANAKYEWIAKLFSRGACFGDVEINSVYKAREGAEKDYYRTVVRVEWTADIDN